MPQQLLDHFPWRNPANLKTLGKAGLTQFLRHFVATEPEQYTLWLLQQCASSRAAAWRACLPTYMHIHTRVCAGTYLHAQVCAHIPTTIPPAPASSPLGTEQNCGMVEWPFLVHMSGVGSLCFCHVLNADRVRKPSTARGSQTHLEKVLWSC